MKYLMLLTLLLLTGCSEAIYPSDFTIASEHCKNNEGVYDIRLMSNAGTDLEIRCNNKAVFSYVVRTKDKVKDSKNDH